MLKTYEIAVYYFPNYHPDERNAVWHGKGWTEWELVRRATPRFSGHGQPKVPLWGFEDESDPRVMARKITAAADHAITAFIFDWYWYEDGPFLQRALDEGFLAAANNDRLKFSLMWANHDWTNMHPATRIGPWPVLCRGAVSPDAFRSACGHVLENYFPRPNYWRVNGGLYFSIYDLKSLVNGFGSIANTRAELDRFRRRVRDAGLGELHLNAVVRKSGVLPGEEALDDAALLARLGFDSTTSYVWIHLNEMPEFPVTPYESYSEISIRDNEKRLEAGPMYIPNVTMGWDSSPRRIQSDVYDRSGPLNSPVLTGNTPEAFRRALEAVKAMLDRHADGHTDPPVKRLTINAWNEWTEGSYLEPDTRNGMKYLEAIRDVFASRGGN